MSIALVPVRVRQLVDQTEFGLNSAISVEQREIAIMMSGFGQMNKWRFGCYKVFQLCDEILRQIGAYPEDIALRASAQPETWSGRTVWIVFSFYPPVRFPS
ncbi:hypothetical protein QBD00_002083 [Ochrobactrum sp. AN78]|nr:hypothetical protein [Ochrobactrum sp. AN78]